MEPPILFLKDIHLNFGGTPLLTGADIQIARRERICLVGRNGSGKSTLMKIAAGMIEADSGERFIQPGVTLRYLPQEPDLSRYSTVLDYVKDGLAPGDDDHRASFLLAELGMTGQELPRNLSGGEIRRAALARTLAPEPDILLLDEPTNHLDLPAIEWLENELKSIRSALVLISHDRKFLENLSTSTVWMDRGRARHLNDGFAAFEDWRDKVLEEEEIASHKLERKIVREEHWIVHGVSGRRKRNMRRVRELAELRNQKATELKTPGTSNFTNLEGEQSGKLVAKLDKVSKAYDGHAIIRDFSAIIGRGERVGIVGPNGAGKTTLVNLITGKIAPDSGTIKLGVNLQLLVIDQKREMLKPDWTLKDALTDGSGDLVALGDTTKHVQSYMKDFLFLPEQARTPVTALSGGERGRLMLARALRQPSNFMVLDEPTNDLDLETLDLLQEHLADYKGTVLVVSHDRDFLDRVCTSVIASDGIGIWYQYAGGYSDMAAQKGADIAKRPSTNGKKSRQEDANEKEKPANQSKPQGQEKLSFKQKHALETLPGEMAKLEDEISKLKKALDDPDLYSREPKKFEKYATALSEREEALMAREEQWLELEMLREELGG